MHLSHEIITLNSIYRIAINQNHQWRYHKEGHAKVCFVSVLCLAAHQKELNGEEPEEISQTDRTRVW